MMRLIKFVKCIGLVHDIKGIPSRAISDCLDMRVGVGARINCGPCDGTQGQRVGHWVGHKAPHSCIFGKHYDYNVIFSILEVLFKWSWLSATFC